MGYCYFYLSYRIEYTIILFISFFAKLVVAPIPVWMIIN